MSFVLQKNNNFINLSSEKKKLTQILKIQMYIKLLIIINERAKIFELSAFNYYLNS